MAPPPTLLSQQPCHWNMSLGFRSRMVRSWQVLQGGATCPAGPRGHVGVPETRRQTRGFENCLRRPVPEEADHRTGQLVSLFVNSRFCGLSIIAL